MFLTRKYLSCILFIALQTAAAFAQRGVYVAPRDLTQLTQDAHVIFLGRVSAVAVQEHPALEGMYTVVVTMKVEEVLKGQPGDSYTFRQFIWDVRDRKDHAGYSKGQELLLFMNAPNAQQLSSPTGMQQGRFVVRRKADGSAEAMNGAGNSNLFSGTAARVRSGELKLSQPAAALATSTQGGPVPLKQLQQVIVGLVGVQQ